MFNGIVIKEFICASFLILFFASIGSASDLSDPTAPLADGIFSTQATVDAQELHLASVIVGPKSKVAIINGRRYREFDLVGEYRIVNIQAKVVTLKKGQKSLRLSLSSFNLEEQQ